MEKVKIKTCTTHGAAGAVVTVPGVVSPPALNKMSVPVVPPSGAHPATLGAACTASVSAELGSLGGRCASDAPAGTSPIPGGAAAA